MPSQQPTVSISMPAYNAGRYIGRTIESILAQSFQDWELIIVDDGSADNTIDVVRTFRDERIRIVPNPHIGNISTIRNIGLQESKGHYLMSVDADDLYESNALETLRDYLDLNPDCTAVYAFNTFIDQDEQPISVPGYDISWLDEQGNFHLNPKFHHSWRNILDDFYYGQLQSLMMPRATLDRIGLFNEQAIAEDTEFYLRLFADNFNGVRFIPKPVYRHRIHITSFSNDISRLQERLDNITLNANQVHDIVHGLAGLSYPKSALVTKQYKRHLSIQLNHRNFHALPVIFRHAVANSDMPLGSLLFVTLLEGFRAIAPGFFHNLLRPVGRKLKKLFIRENRFQKRAMTP